jgi:hypothetical protein
VAVSETAEDALPLPSTCWCCGRERPEHALVRLGSHPEVAVCAGCAHWLLRRARLQHDAHDPSPAARVRRLLERSRALVVEQGWHRLPVLGSGLRWIGDRLP